MPDIDRRKFIRAAVGSTMLAAFNPPAVFALDGMAKQLPAPSTGENGSLMRALQNRKSTRSFSRKTIPPQMLSDLLWAAFGVNRADSGNRTAASPMNSQEIEIYVATAEGLFLYDARFHQTVQLTADDIRRYCESQGFVAVAPLNLIYVADFSKLGAGPRKRNIFMRRPIPVLSVRTSIFSAPLSG